MINTAFTDRIDRAIQQLPMRFKGPGGAAVIVKDGAIVAQHTWGCKDLEAALPVTATTRFPICSISKQMTCAVLLQIVDDISQFDAQLRDLLPRLEGPLPSIAQLCHMQSGLRDYWALTVLHGAHHDQSFPVAAARPMIARMRTTHFAPGSSYSYANANFRLLNEIIEAHTGKGLDELYQQYVFGPANMQNAMLSSDTSLPLEGTIGYEGDTDVGFFPATNRIYWRGDAGISASIEDMAAWEQFIDAQRDDPNGIYNRLSAPQSFNDGTPASYGFGLAHETVGGHHATGHGGALRGFRLQRMHIADERLSAVVLLNHEADAHGAARYLLEAALGVEPQTASAHDAADDMAGYYLDTRNRLCFHVARDGDHYRSRYTTATDTLRATDDGKAIASASMRIRRDADSYVLERSGENSRIPLQRITPDANLPPLPEGRYYATELDAYMTVSAAGSQQHIQFSGLLNSGPAWPIYAVGENIYHMPCQRTMDAPEPGNWTLIPGTDASSGKPTITVGCWLARNVSYVRQD